MINYASDDHPQAKDEKAYTKKLRRKGYIVKPYHKAAQ